MSTFLKLWLMNQMQTKIKKPNYKVYKVKSLPQRSYRSTAVGFLFIITICLYSYFVNLSDHSEIWINARTEESVFPETIRIHH